METIKNALRMYIDANVLGKGSLILVGSLNTFASVGNKKLTYENLQEWITYGTYRKGTKYSPIRKTFAHSFLRFTNAQGISNIEIPFNKVRKQKELSHREQAALKHSPISELLGNYIAYKRSANAMSDSTHQCLRFFNEYCANNFEEDSTSYQEMVDGWCRKRKTERPSSFNKRIAPIRSFLQFANRYIVGSIIIPSYLPYERKKYVPHPFTLEELHKLFDYADTISWNKRSSEFAYNVRKMVMPVFLRSLYSTGMRTCEARLLSCDDVDLEYGVINIKHSKGIHEHRIVMHETMWTLMKQYDVGIRKLFSEREAFFPNEFGTYMPRTWESYHFRQAWKDISDKTARVYDLRSNYAVANINSWEDVGPEWFDKLLYLSRSMGHSTIASTTYYYNLVPVFAKQLERISGSSLGELLPDLTDYYNEEQ